MRPVLKLASTESPFGRSLASGQVAKSLQCPWAKPCVLVSCKILISTVHVNRCKLQEGPFEKAQLENFMAVMLPFAVHPGDCEECEQH